MDGKDSTLQHINSFSGGDSCCIVNQKKNRNGIQRCMPARCAGATHPSSGVRVTPAVYTLLLAAASPEPMQGHLIDAVFGVQCLPRVTVTHIPVVFNGVFSPSNNFNLLAWILP